MYIKSKEQPHCEGCDELNVDTCAIYGAITVRNNMFMRSNECLAEEIKQADYSRNNNATPKDRPSSYWDKRSAGERRDTCGCGRGKYEDRDLCVYCLSIDMGRTVKVARATYDMFRGRTP